MRTTIAATWFVLSAVALSPLACSSAPTDDTASSGASALSVQTAKCVGIDLDGLTTTLTGSSCCTAGGNGLCDGAYGRACSDESGKNPYCQQWICGATGCAWRTPAACSTVKLDGLATSLSGTSCCTAGGNGLCDGAYGRACSDETGKNPYCQKWVCGATGCAWQTPAACSTVTLDGLATALSGTSCCTAGGNGLCDGAYGRACSDETGKNPYCQKWVCGATGCAWQTPAACSTVTLDGLATSLSGTSCCTAGGNGLCNGAYGRACSDETGKNPYCQQWVCGATGCAWK